MLWVRSHKVADCLLWNSSRTAGMGAVSVRGTLSWASYHSDSVSGARLRSGWHSLPAEEFKLIGESTSMALGFAVYADSTGGNKIRRVTVPHWFVVCLLAILPARWAWAW